MKAKGIKIEVFEHKGENVEIKFDKLSGNFNCYLGDEFYEEETIDALKERLRKEIDVIHDTKWELYLEISNSRNTNFTFPLDFEIVFLGTRNNLKGEKEIVCVPSMTNNFHEDILDPKNLVRTNNREREVKESEIGTGKLREGSYGGLFGTVYIPYQKEKYLAMKKLREKYEEFTRKIMEILFSDKNEAFLENINKSQNVFLIENKKDE